MLIVRCVGWLGGGLKRGKEHTGIWLFTISILLVFLWIYFLVIGSFVVLFTFILWSISFIILSFASVYSHQVSSSSTLRVSKDVRITRLVMKLVSSISPSLYPTNSHLMAS